LAQAARSAQRHADQVIARLRREIAKVPGATLFLQASQDLNVGGRLARTQYQYTLQDADLNELNTWAPEAARCSCRSCRSCATSPPTSRPTARCCRW
jgi:multidrug efflux pump subunit AcrB